MPYGRLFVYGTLKKGEPNHHWLRPQNGFAKFVANGTTVKKYPLIIATKYNIPFLIDTPGQGYVSIDLKNNSSLQVLMGRHSFNVH